MLKTLKHKPKVNLKKWLLYITALWFLVPNAAFADGDVSTITTALQGIVNLLQGTDARLLATIAIAGIGYFWLAGRMSLKTAAISACGIGVIFGAAQIAALLGAGS